MTLNGGVTLPIPTPLVTRFASAGNRAMTFGLRPEHLTLSGQTRVPAKVVLTEPLGAETLALLRIGDVEMTGRFPPDGGLAAGREVQVGLAMSKMHLFDADSGAALGR